MVSEKFQAVSPSFASHSAQIPWLLGLNPAYNIYKQLDICYKLVRASVNFPLRRRLHFSYTVNSAMMLILMLIQRLYVARPDLDVEWRRVMTAETPEEPYIPA